MEAMDFTYHFMSDIAHHSLQTRISTKDSICQFCRKKINKEERFFQYSVDSGYNFRTHTACLTKLAQVIEAGDGKTDNSHERYREHQNQINKQNAAIRRKNKAQFKPILKALEPLGVYARSWSQTANWCSLYYHTSNIDQPLAFLGDLQLNQDTIHCGTKVYLLSDPDLITQLVAELKARMLPSS